MAEPKPSSLAVASWVVYDLANIAALKQVMFVMKDGRVIRKP